MTAAYPPATPGLPLPPITPLTPAQVQQLSPNALAYLGDTVYELWVRMAYLFPPKKAHAYHQQVVAQVRAEAQVLALQRLLPDLTAAEQDILRRGRNASGQGPKRLEPELYQQASSLETLIGYLYLTNPERLFELLAKLALEPEPNLDATAVNPVSLFGDA